MADGYIKLHRKITEWGWYKDANTMRVFMHLLLTANFRETEYRGYKIMPGQTVTGTKALAEQLGLSTKNVRTALDHLKKTGEVAIRPTNRFSIVTIEKWEDYQCFTGEGGKQSGKQVANKRQHHKKEKKERIYTTPLEPKSKAYREFKTEEYERPDFEKTAMPDKMRRELFEKNKETKTEDGYIDRKAAAQA